MKRRRRKKHIPEGRKVDLGIRIPSQTELDANLRKLDEWLAIQRGDLEHLSPEEVQTRISVRVEEQDKEIYPRRVREGRVTSEWRSYAKRRAMAERF